MAEIRNLVIKSGVDNTGLTKGLSDASNLVDDWRTNFGTSLNSLDLSQAMGQIERLQSAVGQIKPPALPAPSASGGAPGAGEASNPVGDLSASIEPLLGKVQSGLTVALKPLNGFAARFSAQFDQVGGAVLALAERIDEHMKFPKFQERITQARAFLKRNFLDAPKDVEPGIKGVTARVLDIPESWHTAVAEIEHSKPDLSGFVHEVQKVSDSVKDGIMPPVDGKGYDLDKGARSRAAQSQRRNAKGQFAKNITPSQDVPDVTPISGDWTVEPVVKTEQAVSKLNVLATTARRTASAIDTFRGVAGSALSGFGSVASAGLGVASTALRGSAVAADIGLAAWLQWEKLKGFWRNLGSVAEKSFAIMAKVRVPSAPVDVSASKQIEVIGKAANVAIGPVKGLGREIAMALGVVGIVYKATQAFSTFISDGVKGASDLNETIGMFRNVMGDASGSVEAFADDMSKRFGIVKKDTLDVAAAFGGLGKGLGNLKGKELEDFTKKYTKLAADLSSSKNIGFAEAGKALQVALSGEQSDVLKQLGVITTENTVKAYAYAHGIAKVGDELTDANKLAAVGGILSEKLGFADNDLEETIGGAANAFRRFKGTISNLGTEVGSLLLPILVKVLGVFNEFASGGLIAGFEKLRPSITRFADSIGTGLGKAADSFKALVPVVVDTVVPYLSAGLEKAGEAIGYLGTVVQELQPVFADLASQVGTAMGSLIGSISASLPTLDDFKSLIAATFTNVVSVVGTAVSTLMSLPATIDGVFGEGSTKNLVLFGTAVGGLTLAFGALGSILGSVAGLMATVAGVLTSVPVLVGAAVAGVLYLTGAFSSWQDVIDTLGFAWRNFGDIFGAIYAKVKGLILQLGEFFKSLGESLWNFLKNPTEGFNWTPMVDRMGEADAKIKQHYDKIAKREADLRAKVAVPIAAPKIEAPKPIEAPKVKAPEVSNSTKELADFANKIGEKVKTPVEKFKEELDKLDKAKAANLIDDETYRRGKTQAIKDAGFGDVAKANEPIERFRAEMERLQAGLKAGAIDQGAFETLRDKAAKDAFGDVLKKGDDPLAKFKDTMAKAGEALKAGVIDQAEFNHIDMDARKELASGMKKEGEGQKFAGAQELGSTDFFESVVKAIGGSTQKSNQERLLNSQLSTQERIARGIDALNGKAGLPVPQMGIA